MASAKAPRSCLFCGGRPLTREHIIPRWMTDVLPEQLRWRAQDQAVILFPGTGEEVGERMRTREVAEKFNDATVRWACARCNTGWMNDIETAARPSLSRLIRGEACTISADDVAAIATWAVKTTLVAQVTGQQPAALESVCRSLFEARVAPDDSQVWMAAVDWDDWALRIETPTVLFGTDRPTLDVISTPCNTVTGTIGLGHLLLHVGITTSPTLVFPPLEVIYGSPMTKLWPHPQELDWPTGPALPGWAAWDVSRSLALWLSEEDHWHLVLSGGSFRTYSGVN